jgi:hypothetical protein
MTKRQKDKQCNEQKTKRKKDKQYNDQKTKRQTIQWSKEKKITIYKALHRKIKIAQHESH